MIAHHSESKNSSPVLTSVISHMVNYEESTTNLLRPIDLET
jgi:hypothetical protein